MVLFQEFLDRQNVEFPSSVAVPKAGTGVKSSHLCDVWRANLRLSSLPRIRDFVRLSGSLPVANPVGHANQQRFRAMLDDALQ